MTRPDDRALAAWDEYLDQIEQTHGIGGDLLGWSPAAPPASAALGVTRPAIQAGPGRAASAGAAVSQSGADSPAAPADQD